jgi:hypothetical protein
MGAMPASVFLRYLLLPLHFTVLIFIAVVSLGLALARYAGLFGLPLAIMFLAWVVNYAFVLLEAIANGAREPPVFAIEMVNPFNESRAVIQLCLLLLIGSIVSLLAVLVAVPLAIALALVAFIALPASTGALAVGTSIWQCVHPGAVWHIVRTMGVGYVAIVAVVIGYGLIWMALERSGILFGWPLAILTVFAWLSIFALIGGSLFEHRELLGHEAMDSPERRATRVQYETDRQRARFLDRVHFEARSGNLPDAWKTIELELAQHNHAFEFYDWLLDRLSERTDPRLAYRLAQDYIARALVRDNARATQIAQKSLRADASFRPRSGAQCLRVAELLRLSGDRQNAQNLLRDFAQHFPQDPGIAQAQSMLDALSR